MANAFRFKTSINSNILSGLAFIEEEVIPSATRNTLNDLAFGTQRVARKEFVKGSSKNRTIRNAFSEKSIRAKSAKKVSVDQMQSEVGVPEIRGEEHYLKKQEEGFRTSAMVPAKAARIGKRYDKLPRRVYYKRPGAFTIRSPRDIPHARTKKGKTFALLIIAARQEDPENRVVGDTRKLLTEGTEFGFPGTKEFFALRKGDLPWIKVSGFYQFRRKKATKGKLFPPIQIIYADQGLRINKPKPWLVPATEKVTRNWESFFERNYDKVIKNLQRPTE